MLDRKRINDALDKHLEKSSPSISRTKGSAIAVPSTSTAGEKHIDPRNSRCSSTLTTTKNKCSDVNFDDNFVPSTVNPSISDNTIVPSSINLADLEGFCWSRLFPTEESIVVWDPEMIAKRTSWSSEYHYSEPAPVSSVRDPTQKEFALNFLGLCAPAVHKLKGYPKPF